MTTQFPPTSGRDQEKGVDCICEALGKERVVGYTGDLSTSARERAIDAFRTGSNVSAFVATRAGGIGLTLTEASYVVHFDHWWNPAVGRQAEDRAHRWGQKAKCVTIYHLWAKDTIDEHIRMLLQRKQGLFDETIDSLSSGAFSEKLTMEELYEVLGIADEYKRHEPQGVKEAGSTRDVFNKLQAVTPLDFEKIMAALWAKMGYSHVQTTKASQDGGVDVMALFNTPTSPEKVVGQCKHWSKTVGVAVVRELGGVIASDTSVHRGVLMVTGEISEEARRFAKGCRIDCWDGLQIAELLRRYDIPVCALPPMSLNSAAYFETPGFSALDMKSSKIVVAEDQPKVEETNSEKKAEKKNEDE